MEISIIIPAYNKIKYLRSLLRMVVDQTFREYECILIDDGSTDGCSDICDEFANSDKRFITIHIPNGGVSHARNVGLDKARGKYITFIDSDDEIKPTYLENLYSSITNSGADLVISSYERICDGLEWSEKVQYSFGKKEYSLHELLPRFAMMQKEYGIFGWCWGKLIKKESIGHIRFNENIKLAEDFEFYLKVYPQIDKVYFDDHCFYRYRINSENGSMISAADDDIDYLSQLKICISYREFLQNEQVFSEENESIVNEMLSNYAFFSLFHGDLSGFIKRFYLLYMEWKENLFPLDGTNISSRIILYCLKYHTPYVAKTYMSIYRIARRILKGH